MGKFPHSAPESLACPFFPSHGLHPSVRSLYYPTICHPTWVIVFHKMSDFIKHECGVAFVRLRKPISYFIEKYGTPLHGFNKLFLLMEKQHNRGQDGVA